MFTMCLKSCSRLMITVIVLCVEILGLSPVADTSTMHYVYWNTSSPIFRIDNTDHIIDVNKGNMQFEYDQVNIICPVYNDDTPEDMMEKYIIYNVSKEEYDTCRITNPSPRVIAVCDKPKRVVYFTITFRSFTPQPGGLEFLPGQDYYFISTSSADDLHRRIGGRCSTNHMKVIFKICCSQEEEPSNDEAHDVVPLEGPVIPKDRTPSPTTTTTTTTISTTESTTVISVTTGNSTYYEVVDTRSSSTTRSKEKDPYPPDPGENEIVQKGELNPGAPSSAKSSSASLFIAFTSILISLLASCFSYELALCKKIRCRYANPTSHSSER